MLEICLQLNAVGFKIIARHCEGMQVHEKCTCGNFVEHKSFMGNTKFLNECRVPFVAVILYPGDVIGIPRYFPHTMITLSDLSMGFSTNWSLESTINLLVREQLWDPSEGDGYMYQYAGESYSIYNIWI